MNSAARWALRAVRSVAAGALVACWLAPVALAVDPLDVPFAYPQYMVHATGHGTTSGGVSDDFYTLLNNPPDANGHYTIPDGNGGTYGYNSDFHVGPLNTPRDVCNVAAAQGIAPQEWTVAYDYNTSFNCAAVNATPIPIDTTGPLDTGAGASGVALSCNTAELDASGTVSCSANYSGTSPASAYQWYVDGVPFTGSGASQDIPNLSVGTHQVQVTATVDGQLVGPAQTQVERTAATGQDGGDQSGGGVPIEVILGVGALAAALAAAALAWQRAQNQKVKTACDELGARFQRMGERRARELAGLNQGAAQLARAYQAERDAGRARDALATQRNEAIALIAGAGGLAAGTLAAMAATAAAVGSGLSSALSWVAGGSEAVLDYVPVIAGGTEPALGLGVQAVNAASAAAQTAFGEAATLGGAATGIGGAAAERIRQLLTSGLAQVDASMAQAAGLRQQLEAACQARVRELGDLDSQIGEALTKLAGCPDFKPGQLQDPRTPLPGLPIADGPPQG